MIQVTRKDGKESAESVLRRFTRKVQQSGVLSTAKAGRYFEKPMSKTERRRRAIQRRERRSAKFGKDR